MNPELLAFHNRLRVLFSIDRDELEKAGVIAVRDPAAWNEFMTDPVRAFLRLDDPTLQKMWMLIEARHTGRAAGVPQPVTVTQIIAPQRRWTPPGIRGEDILPGPETADDYRSRQRRMGLPGDDRVIPLARLDAIQGGDDSPEAA